MWRTLGGRIGRLIAPAGILLCAGAALLVAAAAHGAGSAPDPSSAVAAENAAIEARISDTGLALDGAQARLARLRGERAAIEAAITRIEAYAGNSDLGREFVETVLEQSRALPRPTTLSRRIGFDRVTVAASDAHLRTMRELGAFRDRDATVTRRLVQGGLAAPQTLPPDASERLRAQLARQHELLVQLEAAQSALVSTLREERRAQHDFERWSADASARLVRLLYWVPVRPGWQTISELGSAAAWTLSPQNWADAAVTLRTGAARAPYSALLAFVLAIALFAARARLRRMLAATAPDAHPPGRYRLRHAFAALAVTIMLAVPLPLAMQAAGALLHLAPAGSAFVHVLAETLTRVGSLLLALSVLAWTLDPAGIAVRHFGWNAQALGSISRAVRGFTAVFVPLVLVTGLNSMDPAPFTNRESLGRAGTVLAMLLLVRFLVHLLGRRGMPMQQVREHTPRSWIARFHGFWFAALLAVPVGIMMLAIAGYFIVAGVIFGRVVSSLFLALAALMLYGFMAVWVRLKHGTLVDLRRDADQLAGPATSVAGAPGSARLPAADIAAMGERTRSLLDLAVTLLLLTGMWLVWRDMLPAFAQIGDYVLWSHASTVDGKTITLPLTVGHVFLAGLVGVVAFVAVRNVGALLDIVLLQRMELQADANYAIKVTARYMLSIVGVVSAASILGIAWDDVQWLVAALSVGLGFGLQEIVANFVAGLIVLIEHPVRIGDVVTIGDVSGTVTRIRARVLTLVDFDNKEVLIPNKSLITDRVINWTLSSQTTRLVLKVSLVSDADLALAQRVIVEAVQRNPDVLAEPGPRVFFVAFGTGALTLEINAFVGSFDLRQRVQHEINVAVDQALRANGIRTA